MREVDAIEPRPQCDLDPELALTLSPSAPNNSTRINDPPLQTSAPYTLFKQGQLDANAGEHGQEGPAPKILSETSTFVRRPFHYNKKQRKPVSDGRDLSIKLNEDRLIPAKNHRNQTSSCKKGLKEDFVAEISQYQMAQPNSTDVPVWNNGNSGTRGDQNLHYFGAQQVARSLPYYPGVYGGNSRPSYRDSINSCSATDKISSDLEPSASTLTYEYDYLQTPISSTECFPQYNGLSQTRRREFYSNEVSPSNNFYYNSPAPPFGDDSSWVAKSSGDKQSATLLTPNSICESPSGRSSKGIVVGPHLEGETTHADGENSNTLSADPDKKAINPVEIDPSPYSPEGGVWNGLPTAGKSSLSSNSNVKSLSNKLDFDFRPYGLTKTQSSVFRKVFDKQLEMLYRSVTDEFNGKSDSCQIGIEFVLSYLQRMDPSQFVPTQ